MFGRAHLMRVLIRRPSRPSSTWRRCFCAGAVSVSHRTSSSAHCGGRASDRRRSRIDPLTRSNSVTRDRLGLELMSSTSDSVLCPWPNRPQRSPSRNRLASYPGSASGKAWVSHRRGQI